MGFAHRLAEWVEGASFDQLPPRVVEASKEMMVNAAAVGLAGAAQPDGLAVTKFAQEMRGNGKCTIIRFIRVWPTGRWCGCWTSTTSLQVRPPAQAA